jgi:hypothetical protein
VVVYLRGLVKMANRALRWGSFLLALVLAFTSHVGLAEGIRSSDSMTPLRPPTHDYISMFQSQSSRIPRYSVSSTLRSGPAAMCQAALVAAEMRYAIPTGMLQAIGIVESGRRNDATGARLPWPWTTNAEGESHFFDTKEMAVAWTRQAQARGVRSIDTGCAQVNLMHHPSAFVSLEAAFDPAVNANYAARFLKGLRDTAAGGNWMTAVGYYHSQTPQLAEVYRQQVHAVTSVQGPFAQTLALSSRAGRNYRLSPGLN